MKHVLLTVTLTLLGYFCFSQYATNPVSKKAIDHSAFENWPDIREEKISGNGMCVAYAVKSDEQGPTLVLQASDNSWKQVYRGAYNLLFTNDSKFALFCLPADSIGLVDLGTRKLQTLPGSNFKIPESGNASWFAYRSKGPSAPLTVLNLSTGVTRIFQDATDYYFSPDGGALIIQAVQYTGSDTLQEVLWLDLHKGKIDTVLTGKNKTSDFAFDPTARQVAFINQGVKNTLMYYKPGMEKATILADENTFGMEVGMGIAAAKAQFSQNGEKIFFSLTRPASSKTLSVSDTIARVDIWSHSDESLQSQQLKKLSYETDRTFKAVINKSDKRIVVLEREEDDWTTFELADGGNAEYVLIRTQDDWSQADWRPTARPSIFLVSTLTGKRRPVAEHLPLGAYNKIYSPKGKYVIWYDKEKMNYFTYNTQTGIIKNISKDIAAPLYNDEEDHPRTPLNFGIAAWTSNDQQVLIYDRYDIWRLDAEGKAPPVNFTNGYGARTKTILRYQSTTERSWEKSISVNDDEMLLLVAFNRANKDNGFYRKRLGDPGDPQLLTMGPYIYYYNFYPMPMFNMTPTVLLKAKYANRYLLNRMSEKEFPNIYTTTDFKTLVALSDLQPQKAYNWMSSELIHWKTFDGKKAEGLLFKPEDFDPKKKYPVIFYFYEKDANGLHNYFRPGWSDGQINIPYLVSNGYVVCDPNIYYTPGQTLESVYNSVVSAARHLSKEPWIDTTRLGIQGHSFGGYEVNCLVGRTSLFAAAVSAAGFCDLVSLYGNLRSDFGVTGLNWIEHGQTGLGTTLWEKPELYIKNSPLFHADKVTTPLLIMHNEQDGASPFSQSVEFFTALRRLGKKVWMLQYDGSSHQVEGAANLRDYTIRLQQFFDHYLKGAPAAKWMVEGVPAALKGKKTGFAPAP